MSEHNVPKISFIIPHKGREAMLIDTLESIAAQDYPKDCIEVILVSQNEQVSQQIAGFIQSINLQVIFKTDNTTIAHSRNIGAQRAGGDYLAFLDADIGLSNNWITAMLDTLSTSQNVVLASAMQVNSADAPPLERIRTSLSNAELDQPVNFLPGRNLFLSAQTFRDVGGFPAHLVTCEDYYFTDKVAKLGQLYYTSNASYVHIGEDKQFYPMFKKEIWRGQSNLASLSGRRIPLREIPSFIVPLAVVMCWLIALISVFYDSRLAGAFGILGMLPTLAYTLRLKRLVKSEVSFLHCLIFYAVYFPARALGTVLGLGKTINTGSHK